MLVNYKLELVSFMLCTYDPIKILIKLSSQPLGNIIGKWGRNPVRARGQREMGKIVSTAHVWTSALGIAQQRLLSAQDLQDQASQRFVMDGKGSGAHSPN